jgi:hypothetical protein
MFLTSKALPAALAAALAFGPACVIDGRDGSGPLSVKTESVPLEAATEAEVKLDISAGSIDLRGADSADLLAATFSYNRPRLEPEVSLVRGEGGRAWVSVRHRRRGGTHFGRIRNTWDLTLSNRIPLDLNVDCGAGETNLDLRGLDLKSLAVDMGVGELKADLTGARSRSLDVSIDGGVGEATLDLPASTGVRVEVDGGLGSVSAPGFAKSGRVYTNEAWDRTPVRITVSVDAGIGSIHLRLR